MTTRDSQAVKPATQPTLTPTSTLRGTRTFGRFLAGGRRRVGTRCRRSHLGPGVAERYERKSIALTSNLVFNQWERIFKNPMTTAAAVDRLVHHAVILEFDVPSFRSGSTPAEPVSIATTTTKTKTAPRQKGKKR